MNNESLETIQIKIAFLERANSELSDVVYRQQKEIQTLSAQLKAFADRLPAAQADETVRAPEQERPPHY